MKILLAEMMGTMFLILMGNGVVANAILADTKGNNGGWIVITTGWAFGVFIGVVVANQLGSAAHLNPAVTLSMLIKGEITMTALLPYLSGQLIGAMLGALLVWVVYKNHFEATKDSATRLACFCTGPAIKNLPINLFSEIIGTFTLIFVLLSFTQSEAAMIGNLGVLPVTILVWSIGLSLGGTTGYAINPARDFSPRLVHSLLSFKGGSDWSYAWIPVVGPLLGAALATYLFLMMS